MPRRENQRTPKVISGVLYTDDAATGTRVGSPAWFDWLASATTFYYETPDESFTAHHERRQRGGSYWIAYRRRVGVLRRRHLGKPDHLTLDRLDAVALALASDGSG
jgi:LuxR family maltose regulon positive regulatory protein